MDAFEDHCWKDVVDGATLEVYSHYKRETRVSTRPALLAIDLYNLPFGGGPLPVDVVTKEFPSSCGIHAWDAIKPIQELLALARGCAIPVIYTTNEAPKQAGRGGVQPTRRHSAIPEGAFAIADNFKPADGDLIVYKKRASGFFGTPLIAHLIQNGIDGLIICGETTSGCVRATAVDAYSYGFHAVLVEECCFDRSLLSHKINLFDLHHKYADVMHLEEVKQHIEKRMGGK